MISFKPLPRSPLLRRSSLGALALLLVLGLIVSGKSAFANQTTALANSVPLQTHNFTPASTSHTSLQYLNLIEQTMIEAEGVQTGLYDDGLGNPTIGVGYNLKTNPPVLDAVVASFGANPANLTTQAEKSALTTYIDTMATDIDGFPKTGGNITALTNSLNAILGQIKADATFPANFRTAVQSTFAFKDATAAENLFNTVYQYLGLEKALTNLLGTSNFDDSLERVALLSLVYNGLPLKGSRMLSDILGNNRAEAWYEIRYASNALNNSLSTHPNMKLAKGVATRRDYESDLFGLYNSDPFASQNPSPVTNAEAAQIFTMILAHETSIFQSVIPVTGKPAFNNQYYYDPNTLIGNAQTNYKVAITAVQNATTLSLPEPDFTVRTLNADLAPAAKFLLTAPAAVSSGNVLVFNQPGSHIQPTIDLTKIAPNTPVAVFLQKESGTAQRVIVNSMNDLIYSANNATLVLGSGVDQLNIQGSSTLVDTTGLSSRTNLAIDAITLAGKSIAGIVPSSGLLHGYTYTLQGTTLTVNTGLQMLTIKGFKSGNFGVQIGQSPPPAGKILFSGFDAQGTQGLWVTDGTISGTTELLQGVEPYDITTFGNQALFSGYDTQGNNELWITNGTSSGTIELTHITNYYGGLDPYQIAVFGNKAVFNGTDVNGNHELWVTDGKSVQELNNIPGEGSGGLNPGDPIALGNMVLFDGYDSTQNYELWVTDGTAAGTRELTHITSAINGLGPYDITVFGNQALFVGYDAQGRNTLWITNGNTVTELPATIPDEITVIGNRAVFRGDGDLDGLWVTDGTPGGTMQLLNIPHAAGASLPSSDLTAWGNRALLNGLDSNAHDELWVTDGTVGGTVEVTNIASNSSVLSLAPAGITAFGTQALFYGVDPLGNSEIWATNGSTTTELTVPPSAAGPYLNYHFPDITVLGKKALFNARGADGNYNLWVTDGTPTGTTELKNIPQASSLGLSPSDMTLL